VCAFEKGSISINKTYECYKKNEIDIVGFSGKDFSKVIGPPLGRLRWMRILTFGIYQGTVCREFGSCQITLRV